MGMLINVCRNPQELTSSNSGIAFKRCEEQEHVPCNQLVSIINHISEEYSPGVYDILVSQSSYVLELAFCWKK